MVSFLALFLSLSFAALPPTTLKGNSETLKPTTFNIEVPNYQATTSASVTRRIETGNWNQLLNPSFEATAGTTSHSFGTTASISTTNLVEGKKSVELALTSFSGTIASQAVLPTGSLAGLNLESSVYARATMGSIEVCGTSNSTVIQCTDVPAGNVWSSVVTNMPGVAGGTIGYLLRTKNNVAVTGTLGIDDTYVGRARNLAEVSQARFIGAVNHPSTANCIWDSSSTSPANYSADSDCTTPTGTNLEGIAIAPAVKIPAIRFASLGPGRYTFKATGVFFKNGATSSTRACWRFSDGVNHGASQCATSSSTTTKVGIGEIYGEIVYTAPQTDLTVQIQAFTDGAAESAQIIADSITSSVSGLKISVYRWPTQNEIVARAEENNWYIDANIAGANPSLGTAAVSSYTGITNSGLTMTPRAGSSAVGIACSSTNSATAPSNSATTCAVGDESISANFDIPKAGVYEACFSFSTYTQVDSGGQISNGFQVVETATNAQTVLTEGGTRVGQIILGMTIASGVNSAIASPAHVCGLFNWTSNGRKAVRLMYEVETQGNADSNLIVADASASTGQRDVHVTVRPWVSNQSAVAYVGSVTSNSSGLERSERLQFDGGSYQSNCTSTPCRIQNQSGSWISSVARNSTGNYSVNIAAGIFSGDPTCTCAGNVGGGGFTNCQVTAYGSSAVGLLMNDAAGSPIDSYVQVRCQGPR